MANCTHRSEAKFGESAGAFSANAGTLPASARMATIASEIIRIKSFMCFGLDRRNPAYAVAAYCALHNNVMPISRPRPHSKPVSKTLDQH
jgi:hypothetical protein